MLHPIQQKILKLARSTNLSGMGFRKIGNLLDGEHSQKIKHHLEQLEKKGLLYRNKKTRAIRLIGGKVKGKESLFRIPVLGAANCGESNIFAQECIEGYLMVSPGMIKRKNSESLFAIKAEGSSLNKAKKIKGGPVKSGDHLIIDSKAKDPVDGDYVVSIIDECANVKRFYQDKKTKQVALHSESTLNIAPIHIHPDDFPDYMIAGKVIGVIKKVKK